MSILKQKLHRKNASGTYDEIHLQTDATAVTLSSTDTTTVAEKINDLVTKEELTDYDMNANELILYGKRMLATSITGKGVETSSADTFETMAANIDAIEVKPAVTESSKSIWATAPGVPSSQAFTATKSGVTVNSKYITDLARWKFELPSDSYSGTWTVGGTYAGKSDSKSVTVADSPNDYFTELNYIPLTGTLAVGNEVTFDSKTWIVVHNGGNNTWYLALKDIAQTTAFGSNTTYKGSTIANLCTTWMNTNISSNALLFMNDVTVENVTAKVFIPTHAQLFSSGFEYYKTQANRIAKYNGSAASWWTSSPYSSSSVYLVDTDGTSNNYRPSNSFGFRPHICITY